jgi:hypothetical protein
MFSSSALCFHVAPLLPVPLFASPRRLVADALLGMINIDLLLLLHPVSEVLLWLEIETYRLLTSCDCQWDKYFVPSMCSSSNMIGSEKTHASGNECDQVMTIPTTHLTQERE